MEYALSYANQGYAVFPLQPNGKNPLTEHGFKDASRDPTVIQAWWSKWPEANVGIATGRISGIVVLDVDRKHGVDGVVSAAELDLPPTLVIKTPSGGYHLFYKAPPGVIVPRRIGVKPGLDVLGEGGYVVAAGSWVNGCVYAIVRNRPIADCPEALINLAGRQNTNLATTPEDTSKVGAGKRNQYLTSLGGKLRRIGFSTDELVAALLVINTTRCEPPVSEAEVRRTAASVARYEPDADAADRADSASPLVARPISELLAAVYPPAEFVLEPILVHPGLMMVYGPTGVAKTYFCIALGLAVAGGHTALKYVPERARGVLYVDGELGNRALQDRIKRLIGGHEFKPERFYTITRDDQAGGVIPDLNDASSQARFLASIPEDVELVVLDNLSTLTTSSDGKEANSWDSWDQMQNLLLQLRRRGISVIVVHHANKGGTEQSGTERKLHIMDTVVSLRRHDAPDGAVPGFTEIEVHIKKGRNLPQGHIEPYIATLAAGMFDKGVLAWSTGELAASKRVQIEELLKLGMPISQVITETGAAASFAYRVKDAMVKAGTLTWAAGKPGRKKRTGED
jgi:putative DNA primase/helicase